MLIIVLVHTIVLFGAIIIIAVIYITNLDITSVILKSTLIKERAGITSDISVISHILKSVFIAITSYISAISVTLKSALITDCADIISDISVTLKSALITDCADIISDINHNGLGSIGSIGVGIDSKKFSSRPLISYKLFFTI